MTNNIMMKVETVEEFYSDAKEMFAKDWQETTEDGMEFNIDEEEYRKLDEEGKLIILAARDGSTLIGYMVFMAQESLHHKNIIVNCCGFYVDKAYRGVVVFYLIERAKKILGDVGIKKMRISTSMKNNVGRLFERHGGKAEEIIYGFNLDTSDEVKCA